MSSECDRVVVMVVAMVVAAVVMVVVVVLRVIRSEINHRSTGGRLLMQPPTT